MSEFQQRAWLVLIALMVNSTAVHADNTSSYANGWRQARLISLDVPENATPRVYKDCRMSTSLASAPSGAYAVVSFAFGGSPNLRHKMVARLPPGAPLKEGQLVRVNIEDCAQALQIGVTPQVN